MLGKEVGWSTHRYKVFGFLELVFKAGRTAATNGGTMDGDRGWEAVHEAAAKGTAGTFCGYEVCSRATAGTAGECPFMAKVSAVENICPDDTRRTALVRLSSEDLE